MELFINGVLEASQPANFVRASNSNPLTVGMSAQWGGRQLRGAVADPMVFDRALSSEDIATLYQRGEGDPATHPAPASSSGVSGALPGADALVGAWLLRGNSQDSGPLKLAGQMRNAGPAEDRLGRQASALRFHGPEAGIEVAHHPRLELVRGATYAAWFKLEQLPSEAGRIMTILSKPGSGADLDLHVEPDNRIKFYVAGGTVLVSRTPITSGQWHHVVATYQANGQIALYIDGQIDVRQPIAGPRPAANNPLGIGNNAFWRGRGFEGAMSDVLVFDRALTAAEIESLYEN